MKKLIALCLAILLVAGFAISCKKTEPAPEQPPVGNTETPSGETPSLDASLKVRVFTLNGTTGFGMAPLMNAKEKGEAALNYDFTVETNAQFVRDAVINGSADIAAVPTNIAALLYNVTNGGVKVLAVNTAGVLYLVTNGKNGASAASLADLSGKTVYCPAQNPYFITKALIEKAGVADVTIDHTTYSDPTDLRDQVASGVVDYAILPEPMVTIALSQAAKNDVTLNVSLDLTAEWDKYFEAGSLVQGCVVVRSEFLTAHPAEVAKFMEEYENSIAFVNEDPASAAQMIASAGIFAQAAVAQKAIPKCNICFVKGAALKAALGTFLAEMPINSIGNKLPDDDFYYGA